MPRRIVVRNSPIHGKGVFALRRIAKGTRIIEYKGERVSPEEGDRRYPYDPEGPNHTFLFSLDDVAMVDADVGGNSARFINHSCDPNCESVIDEDGRIFIEALRAIRPGEELTYDYRMFMEDRHTPAAKRSYPCACGARSCRGTLLAPKRRRH